MLAGCSVATAVAELASEPAEAPGLPEVPAKASDAGAGLDAGEVRDDASRSAAAGRVVVAIEAVTRRVGAAACCGFGSDDAAGRRGSSCDLDSRPEENCG